MSNKKMPAYKAGIFNWCMRQDSNLQSLERTEFDTTKIVQAKLIAIVYLQRVCQFRHVMHKLEAGAGFEPSDLRLMRPPRYHFSTPLYKPLYHTFYLIPNTLFSLIFNFEIALLLIAESNLDIFSS